MGKNGIDKRNEAGENLLQFCAMNQLHLVPEEGHLLWNMDAPSNETLSHD